MSYFSGRNGKLSIKDADAGDGSYREIGRMRDWTISATTETIDTTCLSDLDRTILPGLRKLLRLWYVAVLQRWQQLKK